MKRIGVFQLYNENEILEKYVEVLLKSMKTYLTKLVIVINGNLKGDSYQRLLQYSNIIYKRDNLGYDAGAYKDIFLGLHKELWEEWDEVILFNCTFYGPLFSWDTVFEQMEKEPIDFWGLSRHLGKERIQRNGLPAPEHLQSYFLVIKKNILKSPFFKEFWKNLDYPLSYYEAVEKYEWKFTSFFKGKGFKYSSWLDKFGSALYMREGINPCSYSYELIRDCQFPIIKCKQMSISNFKEMCNTLNYVKEHTSYDIEIIKEHLSHLNQTHKWKPFSADKLEKFVNEHNNIYIFGHGKYGSNVEAYFQYRNWNFKAFVVSKPETDREIAFESFSMNRNDGLIVALGKIALDEMEAAIQRKFYKEQLLFPAI